jgi:4-amino-4-deoxy-L-arabinose transferase-like glycosyltransferase
VALAAIVLLAGGLRWLALDWARPLRILGDEVYYGAVAGNIASGRGHVYVEAEGGTQLRSWRPPAQAWVLSLVVDPARRVGLSVPAMALLQGVLSTLLVATVAGLGWALFDVRTGLLAAGIAAVYPNLVAHSHYLWAEPLFGVLIVPALTGVAWAARRPSAWLAAATGLLFGAATLTREVALPVAVVGAAWWVLRAEPGERGAALRRSALMLGALVLVVAPWTARNYAVQGRFIPVGTIGWFTAGEGNTLEENWMRPTGPRVHAYSRAYFDLRDEIERMDFARAQAFQRILEEQPAWLFKKTVRNMALMLSPDSYLLFKMRRGAYGPVTDATYALAMAACAGSFALVLVGGAVGLAIAPGRRGLTLGVLATVAALHVALVVVVRYRLPWMPLLMVYASHAALRWRELPTALRGGRWLGPALVLLFFLGVAVPAHVIFGGRQ